MRRPTRVRTRWRSAARGVRPACPSAVRAPRPGRQPPPRSPVPRAARASRAEACPGGQQQRRQAEKREYGAAPLGPGDPAPGETCAQRDGRDQSECAERLYEGERPVFQRRHMQEGPCRVEADRPPPGAVAEQPQQPGARPGTGRETLLSDRGRRITDGGEEREGDGGQGGIHGHAPREASARAGAEYGARSTGVARALITPTPFHRFALRNRSSIRSPGSPDHTPSKQQCTDTETYRYTSVSVHWRIGTME